MRLALVSDIHGNLPALEAVVADIACRGVDQVLCLGDNLSGPLLPRETAQCLMASGWPVLAGNHERQILEWQPGTGGASDGYALSQLGSAELDWLRRLRPMWQWAPDIFLCHGTPRSDCEHFLETPRAGVLGLATAAEIAERRSGQASALIACGHSHLPRCLRTAAGQLLLNPGSVGLQAYVDDAPERYVLECGTPDAHYAIVERIAGDWQASLLAVPYDHRAMAALAQRNGRPDWAHALLTGYVG
ncbi:metallophosphoesterase family protein [Roseateles sp.]|uniref:metallophosphoesterase family protein n=1 Tax=Roseateles sp. TaxID=1971397 RepID=UPI0025FA6E76|nr:metallophosphoesterase family protein [Roseateles sp.]MBV8036228.1 metallophosphoesterase family protein [Roseateles sp.]